MALDIDNDIKIYLTGASSDGGAQTDPESSLGNYRSSTLWVNDSDQNLFPIVTYSKAQSGEEYYLALCFKNENGSSEDALSLKFWLYEDAGTTTTNTYASSGAVNIPVNDTSAFDTNGGYLKNTTTGEIMYYTGISGSNLVVPSAGRGVRGSSASGGSSGDTIIPYPWCDIATEVNPANKTAGAIQTIADIYTSPTLNSDTNGSWVCPVYATDRDGYTNGVGINNNGYGADLDDSYICFVWFKFIVPAGAVRNPSFDINILKYGAEN